MQKGIKFKFLLKLKFEGLLIETYILTAVRSKQTNQLNQQTNLTEGFKLN